MKNITRRDAAKAVALGTAAAFVAPAALADGNPDADILALARELERIETVVLPPLQKAQAEAERKVIEGTPAVKAPRLTPDEDPKAWQEYSDWLKARERAEEAVGFPELDQRMNAAEGEAEAIREKICTIPARTKAGYLVKLKIAMDGERPDTLAAPEYITDKALVSLLHDLKAGA